MVPMSEITRDSNGNELNDGDTVIVTKNLKVKGASLTVKGGTKVKNIRLTNNSDEIECSVEGVRGLVLRTEFVKKA
jgi:protein PhnA